MSHEYFLGATEENECKETGNGNTNSVEGLVEWAAKVTEGREVSHKKNLFAAVTSISKSTLAKADPAS